MALSNIRPSQRGHAKELFGPVALVLSSCGAAHAVRLANDSRFGLGASVWTRDVAQVEAMARQLENGAVFINGLVKSRNELPVGGVNKSGYGRELSCWSSESLRTRKRYGQENEYSVFVNHLFLFQAPT